jgi:FHS family L-fucose permease-like MFS transporter
MWGFITALNDILIPHLKGVFSLSYTQATLIQFCFFGAYFLVSVPAGWLVNKIGFQKGIGVGLSIAAIGCLLFIPAAKLEVYVMFLGALFILAGGVTILQVSANPMVALMGDPKSASSRLTLTQGFNSLGTTIAPSLGGYLIFSSTSVGEKAGANTVILPYVVLAAALFFIAVFMMRMTFPQTAADQVGDEGNDRSFADLMRLSGPLFWGVIGIFMYVGAEVSIGSFIINFLAEESVAGLEEIAAASYLTYYWGGAMVGRFIGAALMQKIRPGLLLGINAGLSVLLILTAVMTSGSIAMWAILLVGFFNSIMFPTIFSLALRDLGKYTSKGSGLLCLAIVGGAIVPVVQGAIADSAGLQLSFVLPMLCYIFIIFYGLVGSQYKVEKL